ncbi:putative hydrolase of the HAD superfamily [Filimonas lacunae]|uniref:Putative hydrolase of the HAD superfamily n=1 Tax=Filimonas lacunae TaxID=477680 RepID=A0A173MP05_9BACT|nr:HAD family phosphatase [Filimonas lacunae]BAV09383.1 haloacid dehalogenase-like hydrolase [Filimonas lacunae]SIS72158.1 putative hydrolase of the HAD superfamily [Filimonas lacunae]
MQQPVQNIIFDLGGVFLNIDYGATRQAFIDLGIDNFDDLYSQSHSNHLFENLETGKVTPARFYDEFRLQTGKAFTDEQIKNAWNAMLLDFPAERLEWLEKVKNKYRIYLFSNTNQIHHEAFCATFSAEHNGKNFDDYFIKAYYSHTLGLRKPYAASFLELCKAENLDPAYTLFIDDTSKNIQGAQEAGLQTVYLQAPATVLDLGLL